MRSIKINQRPEGLRYTDNLISPDEERKLLHNFESISFRPVEMHGVKSRRLVAHFGWSYDYGRWQVAKGETSPAFLEPLTVRAAAVSGVDPAVLEEVLVTKYPAGAGINWHRDAPAFGSPVVGVSLLSSCEMRFRRERHGAYEVYKLTLAPRSCYVMTGESRTNWQHSIKETAALRYSVTFRTVLRRGVEKEAYPAHP